MPLKSTKDKDNQFINVLVHGPSGAGKTSLIATCTNPLIISAEAGLLSLRQHDFPVFELNNYEDLAEAFVIANEGDYDWVCVDSLSEIAELCLIKYKKENKDGRMAYVNMADTMHDLIRALRDLPKNVYFTSKQDKVKDGVTGQVFFGPGAPGEKFANSLPYFFDEVFALHAMKNEDGETERMLQTDRDTMYDAKDRSGSLDMWEKPDLTQILNKIKG